jgi:hypothetical protein
MSFLDELRLEWLAIKRLKYAGYAIVDILDFSGKLRKVYKIFMPTMMYEQDMHDAFDYLLVRPYDTKDDG